MEIRTECERGEVEHMDKLTVGDTCIHSISEIEYCKVDIPFLFNSITQEEMLRNTDWLGEDVIDIPGGKLGLAFRAYLIKVGELNVLVDACNGNHKQRPTAKWQHELDRTDFLDALNAAGVNPAQIDIVVCTHLHCDHVGWLTELAGDQWAPTFPNATHFFSEREFSYFEDKLQVSDTTMVNHGSFEDSVLPVVKMCKYSLVKNDAILVDDVKGIVKLVSTPGHSVDHVAISVQSRGQEALICGDAIHHPIQLDLPRMPMRADFEPELAVSTRLYILEHCANTGAWLLAGHFSTGPFTKVRKHKDRFRFDSN